MQTNETSSECELMIAGRAQSSGDIVRHSCLLIVNSCEAVAPL